MDGNNNLLSQYKSPKFIITLLGVIVLGAIVIVSVLRERIVSQPQNQVAVTGQGKVAYQPDMANVVLGVHIEKAPTAEEALRQINEKMGKIIPAIKAVGIKKEDIATQNYSLFPQHDYLDGISRLSGYGADQQLLVKIKDIKDNPDLIGKVIAEAGKAGTNQVLSVRFDVSDINNLKQQARLKAIADAKAKSGDLAKAAGVKLKKVTGWYENIIQSPDAQNYASGFGAGGVAEKAVAPAPQIPTGTQEIIIEMNLQYEVK